MSPRKQRFRIQDILDAIQAIQEYTLGMTFQEFKADPKTVDAVIRRLMIIGEAVTHLEEGTINMIPEIQWRQVRGMRNIIVHEYFGVSERIVWDTVREDLPGIVEPLKQFLASGND